METTKPFLPKRMFESLPVQFSATELRFEEAVDYSEWERVGSLLGKVEAARAWWIGDWCNYGAAAYGEKYSQAADETGLDYQTLANYAWVSEAIPPEMRRAELSFTHHSIVASLRTKNEKAKWLDHAAAGGWTTRELKKELKKKKLRAGGEPEEKGTCPTCGQPWEGAA
jgi:hypothetical protein